MRYQLTFTLAVLCAASGVAQGGENAAEFLPLRSIAAPFEALSDHWPQTGRNSFLSGDGTSATDGWWKWTRAGGIAPRGLVPTFGPASTVSRYPRGLSFDGSIEFGLLQDSSNPIWLAYYWEDANQFDVVTLSDSAAFVPESRTLSDDGNWIFYDSGGTINPRRRFRQSREGLPEEFLQVGFNGPVAGPSANGLRGITDYGVLAIPLGSTASEAVLLPKPAAMNSYAIAASGIYVIGTIYPPTLGTTVIWNVETGHSEPFNPPRGYSGGYVRGDLWLSDDATIAAGVVGHFYPPAEPQVFVRRAGEQSRKLTDILHRFGTGESDSFAIEYLWGASRDGKTLLLYVTSLSYGDSAAIVTLPDWQPCPSDINFDGFVDDADFVLFGNAYDALTNTDGDFNLDGLTDDADFVLFVGAYEDLLCPQ